MGNTVNNAIPCDSNGDVCAYRVNWWGTSVRKRERTKIVAENKGMLKC